MRHGDIRFNSEAPTCPHCWGEMERFEGIPLKIADDIPARRNVGWHCPTCYFDIDEGWVVVDQTEEENREDREIRKRMIGNIFGL